MINVSEAISINEKVVIKDIKGSESELDFDKIFKESLISPTEIIKTPDSALVQNVNGETRVISTLGNFTLISGKAKSRKSFLMTLLTSLFISNRSFLGLQSLPSINNANVIYFDTEQGKYHVQLLVKRICRLSGNNDPDNLKVYFLRKYSPFERLEIIEKQLYQSKNLGVVVIDGIKDLVTSINDEDQATKIASKLLKWSEELNIHIYVILHQNKGDRNARGHLGSELANKAETYLTVEKNEGDKDISIVSPEMCRNREPDPFAFEIIEGLPTAVDNLEIRISTHKKSFRLSDIEDFKKIELLNTVYSKGYNEFTYKDLSWSLKKEFEIKFSKKLSDHKCRDLINEFKDNIWIVQDKIKGPYKQGTYEN